MSILAWVILGLIAGAIAKAIYPEHHQGGGILSTTLLGIVGAFISGTITSFWETGSLAFAASTLSIPGVVIAVLGAMTAILLYEQVARRAY